MSPWGHVHSPVTTQPPASAYPTPPAQPSPRRDTRRELLALAEFLDPDLRLELNLVYQSLDALTAELDTATAALRETRRLLHDSQVYAGHLADHNAQLKGRLTDYASGEIIKARREAHLVGSSYLKVTSLGSLRYSTEHLAADRVVVRDE